MNSYKLRKSNTHHDTRSSIKQVEDTFFKKLKKQKDSVPTLKKDLSRLLETEHLSICQHQEIETLKQKICDIETNKELIDYQLKFAKFVQYELDMKLNKTNNTDTGYFTKTCSNSAGNKYSAYMSICFNDQMLFDSDDDTDKIIIKDPCKKQIPFCKECFETEMLVEPSTASAICPECGLSINYQDDRLNPEFREGVQIISPYAYKRINHFKEWLAQLQAKETTEIPDVVFNSILMELQKQRITNSQDVTASKLRTILKKLRFNKYYEHIPTITQKITGRKPPSLSRELEGRLIDMFREIQEPFAKWVKIVAPERKNFLSYSYTLNKMCRILGEIDLIQYFPLLKSREKNYIQDKIWKGICEDLKWEFHKSV
uniref:TFIIB-type domain-containing protein n=1 Tax=viral metagenome TaxID=1070528 RepID=A0A6C0FC79_9ZZZZ|tara:strand:- start:6273 stop:7388 length:1116 start_codon:yes stop_codon:yes gene_type:complete